MCIADSALVDAQSLEHANLVQFSSVVQQQQQQQQRQQQQQQQEQNSFAEPGTCKPC